MYHFVIRRRLMFMEVTGKYLQWNLLYQNLTYDKGFKKGEQCTCTTQYKLQCTNYRLNISQHFFLPAYYPGVKEIPSCCSYLCRTVPPPPDRGDTALVEGLRPPDPTFVALADAGWKTEHKHRVIHTGRKRTQPQGYTHREKKNNYTWYCNLYTLKTPAGFLFWQNILIN